MTGVATSWAAGESCEADVQQRSGTRASNNVWQVSRAHQLFSMQCDVPPTQLSGNHP